MAKIITSNMKVLTNTLHFKNVVQIHEKEGVQRN